MYLILWCKALGASPAKENCLMVLRIMLVCALVFVLSGCQAQRQERPAELKTQPVAIPQTQTKATPAQEASLASSTPANASETELRALRRYNDNAWFIQKAMQIAKREENITGVILTLVRARRPYGNNYITSNKPVIMLL